MTTVQAVGAEVWRNLVAKVYAHQKWHMGRNACVSVECFLQTVVPGDNVLVTTAEGKCLLVIVVPQMTTVQVVGAMQEVVRLFLAEEDAQQKYHMAIHAFVQMEIVVPVANVLVANAEGKCRRVIVAPQITTVLVVIVVDGSLLDAEEDANNRCLRR
eukprot:Seg6817.1 transcript_id=Seg6817.1/GoldUCD/mRNA.D3Y31 product="hypothetical protein" protein_id=Seg6817.1/GoldUCD/D3Y31